MQCLEAELSRRSKSLFFNSSIIYLFQIDQPYVQKYITKKTALT